jgi:hypothetical protein
MPYFMKTRNPVLFGCMPELVHQLLEKGYDFLSGIEGLEDLRSRVLRDPEVRAALRP